MNKEKTGSKQLSKTAIVLDVVAAILLVSFLLSFYNVTVYIMDLLETGSITFADSWLDIILYYVNNTVVYLGLSAILYGLGYVVSYVKKQISVVSVEETVEEVFADDIVEDTVEEIVEEAVEEVSAEDVVEEAEETKTEENL